MWKLDMIDWARAMPILAMGLLSVALLLQLRAASLLRRVVSRDLARIFEQLDLVRFENQQLQPSASTPAPAAVPLLRPRVVASREPGEDYAAALQLAAQGADQREIVSRCGLSAGEARILVAMHGKRDRQSA